nr:small, acid-soluble spore protein, alpha/beta type [Mediterraneibacter glycyrrhizinilyticus]
MKSLAPEEKVKYEIAEELGLLDKVLEHGWKSLTSKETGRIGGLVTKKKRNLRND